MIMIENIRKFEEVYQTFLINDYYLGFVLAATLVMNVCLGCRILRLLSLIEFGALIIKVGSLNLIIDQIRK